MAKTISKIQLIESRGQLFKAIGNLDNLKQTLLGMMCSRRCPGDLVIKGFDTARRIRDQGLIVVSGFHSSMEKDILEILIRGNQPIVHCLAKAIETYRIPQNLRPRVESGQLTVIAPDFPITEKRITEFTSGICNTLVMEICDQVLIIHAHEGGNLVREIALRDKKVTHIFALNSPNNDYLFKQGLQKWD